MIIWVIYNDLTVLPHWNHGSDSGNDPQIALFQISELLCTQVDVILCYDEYEYYRL